jgi:DNA-binding winged helix-turn-helix (wHTH) protein
VPDDPREVERHIIMLTGRDDEIDKLLCVRLGADDYITKPFSPRELGARIEALVRRPRANDTAVTERTFGSLTIVPSSRQVRVAGEDVELTRIEFDLLDTLTANPSTVFTRAQLIERVWGSEWYTDDHVGDVHIANLRKKIDRPGEKSLVRTVRGVGYGLSVWIGRRRQVAASPSPLRRPRHRRQGDGRLRAVADRAVESDRATHRLDPSPPPIASTHRLDGGAGDRRTDAGA